MAKPPRIKSIAPRLSGFNTSRLQHKAASITDSWRAGKTTTERGYGWRWQKARELYLQQYPLCVYCSRLGYITAASVVDHIIPHRGNQILFWDVANWQSLCKPCHDSIKQREEHGDNNY